MIKHVKRMVFGLLIIAHASAALAGPMLTNSDRREYEIKIQCKADSSPMDEVIEVNGVLELDTGPCTIKLGPTQSLVVRDSETAEIRSGKLGLQ
jgi:hypothetical protein